MYQINVEIRDSQINGKGVFSLEKIPKNTIVWKFDVLHDKTISVIEYNKISNEKKVELDRIAYLSPTSNTYVYPPDNDPARFTNHSKLNNLSVIIDSNISNELYFISNKDIEIGDEITNNYFEFDEAIRTKIPDWI